MSKNRITLTIIAAAAFAALALTSPAEASPVHQEEASNLVSLPSFAQPLDAFDGGTLAQYVSVHQEARLHVVG